MTLRGFLIPALAATALLAGCTFSANLTASPESVENAALTALQEQTTLPIESIDCGDENIDLVVGTEVPCVAIVDGVERDAVVTITSVDGTNFSLDVDVPAVVPEDEDSGSSGETIMIPRDEIATLAEEALTPQYGSTPVVICAGNDVPLEVGTAIECVVRIPATGAEGVGTITITEVEGTRYAIDVQVVDA